MLAVAMNNLDVLSLFLKNNPNFKSDWYGLSPLMLCSSTHSFVKLIDRCNSYSFITLSQLNLLNSLRFHEPMVFGKEKPIFVIDFLCMKKDITSLEILLEKYPDTALLSKLCFLVQCDVHITLLLLKYMARVDQSLNGMNPLHLSCIVGNLEMCAVYLDMRIDLNKVDDKGNTPLHYASMYGNIECMNYLIKCRGRLDIKNVDGRTPMDVLSSKNDKEICGDVRKVLLDLNNVRKNVVKKKSRFTITRILDTKLKRGERAGILIKRLDKAHTDIYVEQEIDPMESLFVVKNMMGKARSDSYGIFYGEGTVFDIYSLR
jgi:hypothetical protein